MLISRSSRLSFVAFAVAAALLAAGHATATSVTSTSFAGWKTSLTGGPTEANFSTSTISNTSYNTVNGLTLNAIGNNSLGFTFTGPDNGVYRMNGTKLNGSATLTGSSDAGAGLNIAMPGSGVNAFLLSIGTIGGTPISIVLSDGETFASSAGLFGISVSHPISSLLLTTTPGSQVFINDFYFGAGNLAQDPIGGLGGTDGETAPAAEAATSLLMAGGCLMLFGVCRKFRHVNLT